MTISTNGAVTGVIQADQAAWLTSSVSGGLVLPQLLTVTIGNSINGAVNNGTQRNNTGGADPLGWWNEGSDIHLANKLNGSVLRFGRITASTRADKWGNYSYSGQTLATINSDIQAQLYTPLNTASLKPDLIVGHSLLENDIAGGATYAQCVSRLTQFILTAQGQFPTARIWLCTPRPSFSNNTPAIVAVFQQITAYMLTLDNGRDVFVTQMNGYESTSSPGTPQAGFTDATVHPNVAGGFVNGRTSLLPTLRRICRAALPAYRCLSGNFAQTGSTAASGTGVSGTCATGASHAATSNGTVVLTANDPSTTLTYTQTAGQARDLSTYMSVTTTVTGFTQYAPYMKVRIDSGAEQLRLVGLLPRYNDGTTDVFYNMGQTATTDGDPGTVGYANGDILTLRSPPVIQSDVGSAGAFTSIRNYLRVERKTGGTANCLTSGSVTLTVLDSGVGCVA